MNLDSPEIVDLTRMDWELSGWRPMGWRLARSAETTFWLEPDIAPVPARFPGTVQENLRRAGIIGNWLEGLGTREVEWVEHRHWMFRTRLSPDSVASMQHGKRVFLEAESLDYSGWILVDGREAGTFAGPHKPVRIDLTGPLSQPPLEEGGHILAIVFDLPPEVDGQLGWTSRTRWLKPRYSYSWDWCPRLVPIGHRGFLQLSSANEAGFGLSRLSSILESATGSGIIEIGLEWNEEILSAGDAPYCCQFDLTLGGDPQLHEVHPLHPGHNPIQSTLKNPRLWWPNGMGPQVLYHLSIRITDATGRLVRQWERTLGFKHVEWQAYPGAAEGVTPWVCVVNGRPLFLQGVNWTPVRLAYQDTTTKEYERLTDLYSEMGCNLLRVWGGGFLESREFYDACDRKGLMVWQEFPLSSSGMDSVPPTDPAVLDELSSIARQWIQARRHHVALLMWCGGNELQYGSEAQPRAEWKVCDQSDPCLALLAKAVEEEDPQRRFLHTSPSGPTFLANSEDFGKGLHQHVHGPWGFGELKGMQDWEKYWKADDSTFRSEVGMPGACNLQTLNDCAKGESLWPPTTPLWRHSASWWTQLERLMPDMAGLTPDAAMRQYVSQTQREQAHALKLAAENCKRRFPQCGGFIIWMGHDCFPCPSNTSIIDFNHVPKLAWQALKEVFKPATTLQSS